MSCSVTASSFPSQPSTHCFICEEPQGITTLPTEPFYRSVGFEFDHLLKNFLIDNYPEPIFEDGVQAIDMRYLKRRIRA